MTLTEIEIIEGLATKAHISRLTRSAKFIEGLAAKPDKVAYRLNDTKRKWLFDLLHRYRKALPDLHAEHCEECRAKAESQVLVVQLALF